MPRAVPPLLSFAGGEISPRLGARTDLDKYQVGCKTLRNFIVRPQGPAVRRPGFRYITSTFGNDASRLIPFEFSTVQAYVIEVGRNGVLRFYMDGGQILSGGFPYEVAHPYGTDLDDLQWVQSADVLYLAHPRFAPRKLTRTGHTAWTLTTIDFQDGPYLDEETDIKLACTATLGTVTITSTAALFSAADVGRLVSFQAQATTRVASFAYVVGSVFVAEDRGVARSYRVIEAGTTAATSLAGTTPDYDLNMPTEEGEAVLDGTAVLEYLGRGRFSWGWGVITGFTSGTSVSATVDAKNSFAQAGVQSLRYKLGAWYDDLWPATLTFHEGRAFWGGTSAKPQTVWSSKSGDFENMASGAAADDALTLTLDADQVNALRWLRSARALAVGTAGGEFVIAAGESGAVLAPNNATARRQTAEGSAAVPAVQIGQATLFVQRAGRRVVEMGYQFEADSYASADLTVLADHIARAGIVEMVWQPEPWRVLWCVLADGELIGCTYMRDQRVVAWHRHTMGGGGAVRSAAVISNATANELWVVVARTIDGATVHYIERLDPEFYGESEAEKADAFFVDSGITYDGAPATVITGLSHLEGETVQVLADGATHPDAVVSGGQITLQAAASVVQIGFPFVSRLETLDIDAGAADGTAATRRRRIGDVGVRLFQTLGCKIGYVHPDTGADQLEELLFRTEFMPMDASPPLFTGDKVISGGGFWDRQCRVLVVQDAPLPLTVLGIVPRVTATE